MPNKGIKYEFTARLWKFSGPGGWHFISFPEGLAKEIRNILKSEEEGWGRSRAIVKVGNSEWKAAIWFDTKLGTYLLPLKAEIRKKEDLRIDNEICVMIWI
jgi:hypothetical protein